MYYLWLILICVGVIAAVLFTALWLINRAVKRADEQDKYYQQLDQESDYFYEHENKPYYKQ